MYSERSRANLMDKPKVLVVNKIDKFDSETEREAEVEAVLQQASDLKGRLP